MRAVAGAGGESDKERDANGNSAQHMLLLLLLLFLIMFGWVCVFSARVATTMKSIQISGAGDHMRRLVVQKRDRAKTLNMWSDRKQLRPVQARERQPNNRRLSTFGSTWRICHEAWWTFLGDR